MTCAELIKGLASEMRDACAELKFPTEYMKNPTPADLVKVNIYEQWLPADLFESESYYPLLMIELLKLTDDPIKNESSAQIGMTFGVFAKEADGWLDLFHLIEVARLRLLERRIIAKKFRLSSEVVFELPDEQPVPFLLASAQMNYSMLAIHERFFK